MKKLTNEQNEILNRFAATISHLNLVDDQFLDYAILSLELKGYYVDKGIY